MDLSQLLPYAIFGLITFAVWFLTTYFQDRSNRADERLDELRNPLLRQKGKPEAKSSSSAMGNVLEKAAPTLSKALEPQTELEQSSLRIRMSNAGFTAPNAGALFLTVKVIMLAIGFSIGGGIALFKYGMTQNGLTSVVIGAGLGFYLPEIVLRLMIMTRKERIFLALPDTLDLLVVCVEAGLGLDAAMRRVADEMSDTATDVCNEFSMCNMQMQMGRPRREVLHDLGVRTGVDDMRALSAILIQSDRFGSSIAQALRVQSDSMRVKRRQLAEERAQQTAVKMIFPLVLFIFPGIFVVLVGPAAIMMIDGLLSK
ncbi:MAG: type II secretion system F family protein [Planctomycetaceae bacterium]